MLKMADFNKSYETLDSFEEVIPSSNPGSASNRAKRRRG